MPEISKSCPRVCRELETSADCSFQTDLNPQKVLAVVVEYDHSNLDLEHSGPGRFVVYVELKKVDPNFVLAIQETQKGLDLFGSKNVRNRELANSYFRIAIKGQTNQVVTSDDRLSDFCQDGDHNSVSGCTPRIVNKFVSVREQIVTLELR